MHEIDADVTAGEGELEHLAQDAKRVVGAAGGGEAVGVEPVQHVNAGCAL